MAFLDTPRSWNSFEVWIVDENMLYTRGSGFSQRPCLSLHVGDCRRRCANDQTVAICPNLTARSAMAFWRRRTLAHAGALASHASLFLAAPAPNLGGVGSGETGTGRARPLGYERAHTPRQASRLLHFSARRRRGAGDDRAQGTAATSSFWSVEQLQRTRSARPLLELQRLERCREAPSCLDGPPAGCRQRTAPHRTGARVRN